MKIRLVIWMYALAAAVGVASGILTAPPATPPLPTTFTSTQVRPQTP